MDEMKAKASRYGPDVLKASDKIAGIIYDQMKRE